MGHDVVDLYLVSLHHAASSCAGCALNGTEPRIGLLKELVPEPAPRPAVVPLCVASLDLSNLGLVLGAPPMGHHSRAAGMGAGAHT